MTTKIVADVPCAVRRNATYGISFYAVRFRQGKRCRAVEKLLREGCFVCRGYDRADAQILFVCGFDQFELFDY